MTNAKKVISLIFICIVWGSTWVAIKITLEGIPPMLSAASRFAFASLALMIYLRWKRIPIAVTAREFRILTITAFLMYVTDYGFIYWGEQYISAGVTSIFFATFAIFTALLSNFIFKNEAFNLRKFVGVMIGFAGILTVFYDQLAITRFDLKVIIASTAILLAALSAAISMVVVKKYLPRMETVSLTFHQIWIGTVFLLIIGLITENPAEIRLNVRIVGAVIYMGVIASALAFAVYYKLLQHMSAISLSLTIYVIPLTALVLDYFIFHEILSLRSFIGMVIVFAGIWMSRGKPKNT